MNERLTPVEAHDLEIGLLRVLQHLAHHLQRQLLVRHEIATVFATFAAEIAGGGQRKINVSRVRADERGKPLRSPGAQSVQPALHALQLLFESRVIPVDRLEKVAQQEARVHEDSPVA